MLAPTGPHNTQGSKRLFIFNIVDISTAKTTPKHTRIHEEAEGKGPGTGGREGGLNEV